MHTIKYKKSALKSLKKMPQGVRERMQSILKEIAESPYTYEGDWKPMQGEPFWRLRVGSWRAICHIQDNELVLCVVKVGSRGDVYK